MRSHVCLTFDDALDEHIDDAAPLLEAHGFRGTFYLPIRTETVTARAEDWRALASRGHELGNHSLFHPCPGSRPWVDRGSVIEEYTLARMRQELALANRILALLDGLSERTYAYPCDLMAVGRPGLPRRTLHRLGLRNSRPMRWLDRHPRLDLGGSQRDYAHLLPDLFTAARAGPSRDEPEDPYRVPCISGDLPSLDALIGELEAALRRTPWVVFAFHGIGGHRTLNCDRKAFEGLLRHLADRDDVVVTPFIEAARSWKREASASAG